MALDVRAGFKHRIQVRLIARPLIGFLSLNPQKRLPGAPMNSFQITLDQRNSQKSASQSFIAQ